VVKDVQAFENSEPQESNNKNQDGTTFLQREMLNAKPATRRKGNLRQLIRNASATAWLLCECNPRTACVIVVDASKHRCSRQPEQVRYTNPAVPAHESFFRDCTHSEKISANWDALRSH
jgi:hypothetical protein